MVDFISGGVQLISGELNFNLGGDYEFTFTIEGKNYLFYLLPWLVEQMPEQLPRKWHFFPCMQALMGRVSDFRCTVKTCSWMR